MANVVEPHNLEPNNLKPDTDKPQSQPRCISQHNNLEPYQGNVLSRTIMNLMIFKITILNLILLKISVLSLIISTRMYIST